MACWAHSALIEFIELYRSEECLWKIKSPSYSNRNLKEQAYQRLLQFVHTFEPTARKHNINCQQIVGIHLSTVAVVLLCRIYSRNVDTHLARTIPWICAMMWIHILLVQFHGFMRRTSSTHKSMEMYVGVEQALEHFSWMSAI